MIYSSNKISKDSNYFLNLPFPERSKRLKSEVFFYKPSISSERARLITNSYKETEDLPMVKRRALALKSILENMSIYFLKNELLAGNQAEVPQAAPIFPEYSVEWIKQELNGKPYYFYERPGDKFEIDDATKNELLEIFKYWKGKTHEDYVLSKMEENVYDATGKVGAFDSLWNSREACGHILPDFEIIINKGFNHLKEIIKEYLIELNVKDEEDISKKIFFESLLTTIDAVIGFSNRYVVLLTKLSQTENDKKRKEELINLAEICRKVPAGRADTFWEALQSYWFAYLINHIEGNGYAMSIGRFDQIMYPFYKKDLDKGLITYESALELIENFWLKVNQLGKIKCWRDTETFTGYQMFTPITIGGIDTKGKDAVNDISFLALKAHRDLLLAMPSLCVRYFKGISEDFFNECIEIIKLGGGMPAIYNDEVAVPSLTDRGVKLEDAYNWAVVGCVELTVPGKFGGRYGAAFYNLPKVLEITLNGGRDPVTGICLFKQDKDLSTFESFEELLTYFKEQILNYFNLVVKADNLVDLSWEKNVPVLYLSLLIQDCIKRGKQVHSGGAIYDYTGGIVAGIANIANSLAAMKKVIYEEKIITGDVLLKILNSDFNYSENGTDGEEIRRVLINKCPKYGNDINYVDDIAKEIFIYYNSVVEKNVNTRFNRGPIGCKFHPSTATVAANVPLGRVVGATPDGRHAYQPLNDGMSPFRGTDLNGPTAVMKTIAKMPNREYSGGNLLNIKLNPVYLKGEIGTKAISDLIKTYFMLGGYHIQINFVDNKTLKEAKKHPENYKDLVVRVAGYSALFVYLDPSVQDDIIERTEHCFC